jgi:Domain of Unknown Function (DUF1080)
MVQKRLVASSLVPVALILLGCATLAAAEPNSPTTAPSDAPSTAPAEIPAPTFALPTGMTRIFDGSSLEGWRQIPENSWTVKNGIIASLGVGRGVIYTSGQYSRYRIIFDMRHVTGNKDHQACVLVFCTAPIEGEKPLDALGGIQFQVPNGGHWDYRKGHNNGGKGEFTNPDHPKFDVHQWSRVEILVDATTGTARMAVAQPVGGKAVEVLDFNVPDAGQKGPFALQMHNKGLFDEYTNIAIEENPTSNELITTK